MDDMQTHAFQVVPHVGVGPVKLGMSRQETRQAMAGFGEMQQGRNAQEEDYLGREFRLAFDSDDAVEFIELSAGGSVTAIYQETDLFKLSAIQAVKLVSRDAPPAPYTEGGHTYTFPDLELAFWRAHVSSSRGREGWGFQTVALAKRGYFSGG